MFRFRSEFLPVKLQLLKAFVRQSIVSDEKFDPRNNFVLPCSWAFEAADQQIITEELIALLPDTLKLPDDIQPKDAVSISYILSYKSLSQRKFTIAMTKRSKFIGKSLKLLLDAVNLSDHRVSDNVFHVDMRGIDYLPLGLNEQSTD